MKRMLFSLIRLFVGGLFIYAGAIKALEPRQFLTDIQNYRLLPYMPAVMLAFYLPYLEIVCGLAVWTRKKETGGLILLLGCTVVFLVALCSAWVRGLNVSCGCFGGKAHTPQFLWWILRDLFIMGVLLMLLSRRETAPGRRS